jgi:hypothetical protein
MPRSLSLHAFGQPGAPGVFSSKPILRNRRSNVEICVWLETPTPAPPGCCLLPGGSVNSAGSAPCATAGHTRRPVSRPQAPPARRPGHAGLAHPGVAADHAQKWIEALVEPTPESAIELVSIEPGRTLMVITVARGEDRPYVGGGRVVERHGNRLVPISRGRITEVMNVAATERPAIEHMAAVIATSAELVERLEAQLHWRLQLPLQLALVIAGVVLGYLLGVWNPLD